MTRLGQRSAMTRERLRHPNTQACGRYFKCVEEFWPGFQCPEKADLHSDPNLAPVNPP